MRSLFARSLMAALTLGTLAVSQTVNAQTDSSTSAPLIFGNTGISSRNLILGGTVSTNVSTTSHESLAQGFTVGETAYQIQSVDLGLYFSDTLPSLKVSLYSSTGPDGDEIPDVLLGDFDTSAPANNGGAFLAGGTFTYNFTYAGDPTKAILQPGLKYWIVVSYIKPANSDSPVFNWQYAASGPGGGSGSTALPGEQGSSGITYLGTLGTHDVGGPWLDHRLGTSFPNAGLRIGVYGDVPVIDAGNGGGVDQTPPTLDCYAYSKGYFKNNYPRGWPASVIANGGIVIGTQVYTTAQLRTMLGARTTRGNQVGQLASQLVAVTLSLELAKQAAGPNYLWWNGWAPDSTTAQAAYDQAAALINASAGFDRRGNLTGCVTGTSNLISALDTYISNNHCTTTPSGDHCNGDDDDDHDDDRRCNGKYRGNCQGRDRQGRRCSR